MAASNPNGEMQFWGDGLPFGGVQKSGNDGGEMQFWGDGQPYQYIYPPSASGSLIKTVNGLVIASVKTARGLAIASVKSINGLTNV